MLLYEKLTGWLQRHDDRLERFKHPIPLSEVCAEINEPLNTLRAFLSSCERPIYHVWTHRYKGQTRSKPYCLHLSGPNDVCLDWEDSVVGVTEAELKKRGYECCREVGTPQQLSLLLHDASLGRLAAGVNQRDLFALKKVGLDMELLIIEGKGKQAVGFALGSFARDRCGDRGTQDKAGRYWLVIELKIELEKNEKAAKCSLR